MTRQRMPLHRTPPPVPNRTVESNSRALPSQPLGTLRTRWTRYFVDDAGIIQTIKLNCWRATLVWSIDGGVDPLFDGIALTGTLGPGAGNVVQVVLGGAMYQGKPVYLNEVHNLTGSGGKFSMLVVEEFFDPATNPNN